jgi:hypothetical protein
MRDTPVEAGELAAARDFLIGVFPLRFETPGAVAGAIAGLSVHGLGLDELTGYRRMIEAVDVEAIAAAARDHLEVDRAAIVLVGDVDAFGSALEGAGLGRLVIDRDDAPQQLPLEGEPVATVGATDEEDETGPTAGAEEPILPGSEGSEPGPAPTDD